MNIFDKIKSFGDSKPCIKTKYKTTTEIYRAASDRKPAFSFNSDGKFKLGFFMICIIVLGVLAVSVASAIATSMKYKKKYKKKLEKIKAKYLKKEEKLLAKLERETEAVTESPVVTEEE